MPIIDVKICERDGIIMADPSNELVCCQVCGHKKLKSVKLITTVA